jgi:hypothetical protein
VNLIKDLATKDDLFDMSDSLLAELRNSKQDIIKWMFIFWVGQVRVTLAILLLKK